MNKAKLWGYGIANAVLTAVLAWNLSRLIYRYQILTTAKSGDILSNNPDFISQVNADTIPMWAWILNIGGVLITLAFMVGWFIPKLKSHKWFGRANFIWLLLWLLYFVTLLVMVVVVIAQLLNSR